MSRMNRLNVFEEQKIKQLSRTDKSNIGKIDGKIKDLCKKLNKKKQYYTTSSCAGRIVLLKAVNKKIKDAFLFRIHRKISFKELKKVLEDISKKYNEKVEFQQTSCILHVACESLEDAFNLVKTIYMITSDDNNKLLIIASSLI